MDMSQCMLVESAKPVWGRKSDDSLHRSLGGKKVVNSEAVPMQKDLRAYLNATLSFSLLPIPISPELIPSDFLLACKLRNKRPYIFYT